jgi:glycosyltransferase involved in cell wall biosynthesis
MPERALLYVAPTAGFFLSHRLPIALAAREAGYAIHVACPDAPDAERLRDLGLEHHPVSIVRGSFAPRQEWITLISLLRLFRRLRPNLAHLITAKPALLGGIAARLSDTPTVSAITGLGYIFMREDRQAQLTRRILLAGYRFGLGHRRNHFIFQNPDDREIFVRAGLTRRSGYTMISGSGVNLDEIRPQPQCAGDPLILMPCRMLRDKGVLEFVAAARLLRSQGSRARFRLLGDPDPDNPGSLTAQELSAIDREGVVEWRPHSATIAEELAQASVVALPSYREGFPKTVIDAAAAGRATVVTDVPGCRDAIVPGLTGELCKVRDPVSLAEAIKRMISDRERLAEMGAAARRHAEANFGIERVIATHLELYEQLGRRRT